MNACVLTIGDELLQGFTSDTNSSWLGTTLLPYNITIQKKITVGDDINSIIQESKNILRDNYDFLFVTGGLGPTHDDITKKALLEYFETSYKFDNTHHEKLKNHFLKRGLEFGDFQKSQSQILSCSKKINKWIPHDELEINMNMFRGKYPELKKKHRKLNKSFNHSNFVALLKNSNTF